MIENAISEAIDNGREVLLVGVKGQTEQRLRNLAVIDKIPAQNILSNLTAALRQAFTYIDHSEPINIDTDNLPPRAIS